MDTKIAEIVTAAVKELFGQDVVIELTRPDPKFGDFATNVAMQLAAKLQQNPCDIATQLAEKLTGVKEIQSVEVAGPGFINLHIADDQLQAVIRTVLEQRDSFGKNETLKDQTVVAEYSDPNPFKVLHAGHLYTSIVGDAIANLLEASGAKVFRVNFGGDVGLHVGKTMWAIVDALGGEHPEKLTSIPEAERSDWMAACYVKGTNAYDLDETAKQEITALNKKVYQLHATSEKDSPFAQIYWTCRQWSYDYFEAFYARIGSHFDRYYPESETAELGLQTVKQHIDDVFKESDGAIVFDGEAHGLHTRVFINREGLPTYEAKDVGLILKKKQDYNFDKSVVITANEQEQYMTVVLKAIEQFAPELAHATTHLTHGIVKLAGGVKMSSRKGNFLRAIDVLDVAAKANKELNNQDDERISLGAVKYAFLKNRTGGDIVYNPEESVALVGNSGPYLQYAHARAVSIVSQKGETRAHDYQLNESERQLVAKISEYPEVVEQSSRELMPHHICSYLYELAQEFNRFYEHNRVIGDTREIDRLTLVSAYIQVLRNGLSILGMAAPDSM